VGDRPQAVYIAEHGDTASTQTGQHAGRRTCRCHLAAKTQRVPSTVSASTARPAIQDSDPESTSPNRLQANASRCDRVRRILDCLLDCDGQPYYLSGQRRPGLFFISMTSSELQSWRARKLPGSLSVHGEICTVLAEASSPLRLSVQLSTRHKDVMETHISEVITYD
jgi:hypothetical protein